MKVIIAGLIIDLIKIALTAASDAEILERLSERVADAAKDIAALPGIQAGRWAEIKKALGGG